MRSASLLIFAISGQIWAKNCPLAEIGGFHDDPRAFLDAPLQKYDKDCRPVSLSLFGEHSITDKSFIQKKDIFRKKICQGALFGKDTCLEKQIPGMKSRILDTDRAENLVPESALVGNLFEMDKLGLRAGSVKTPPWSGWYWPIAIGQLSYRHLDPEMNHGIMVSALDETNMWPWVNNWHRNNKSTPTKVEYLSPSEKYDLLMGDTNYTLTKKMLEAGEFYQSKFGKVEEWMGLCHGWAPASYMLPRPKRMINVFGAYGQEIPFYPSDLKALGTLLWSNGMQSNSFVGGRCNKKDPEKDKNGKILDPDCFDTNPGSWHKTIVGRIGRQKKSFVIDATYDYEVWNHPVSFYSYTFFNPKTMDYTDDLQKASEPLGFANDKFAAYRSKEAKHIVGVAMEVGYGVEVRPSGSVKNSEEDDAYHTVQYLYDLELNDEGEIVGGEWYTNKHPDFLWTPLDGSSARSVVDGYISLESLPMGMINDPGIRQLAPVASESAQPIGKVIESLMKAANRPETILDRLRNL